MAVGTTTRKARWRVALDLPINASHHLKFCVAAACVFVGWRHLDARTLLCKAPNGLDINETWFEILTHAWQDGFKGSLGNWSPPGHRINENYHFQADWEIGGCDGLSAIERSRVDRLRAEGLLSAEVLELSAERARKESATSLARFAGGLFHVQEALSDPPKIYAGSNEFTGTIPEVLGQLPTVAEAARLMQEKQDLEVSMQYAGSLLKQDLREKNDWKEIAYLVEAAFVPAPAREVQRRVGKVARVHWGGSLMHWDERCPRKGAEGRYEESHRMDYFEKLAPTLAAPRAAEGFLELGTWLHDAHCYNASLEPLKRSVELSPNNTWATMHLGSVYGEVGMINESIQFCHHAATHAGSREGLGHRMAGWKCFALGVEAAGLEHAAGRRDL
eukprot:5087132-Amphidinium_carterae.1